jgi:hypothetical protein
MAGHPSTLRLARRLRKRSTRKSISIMIVAAIGLGRLLLLLRDGMLTQHTPQGCHLATRHLLAKPPNTRRRRLLPLLHHLLLLPHLALPLPRHHRHLHPLPPLPPLPPHRHQTATVTATPRRVPRLRTVIATTALPFIGDVLLRIVINTVDAVAVAAVFVSVARTPSTRLSIGSCAANVTDICVNERHIDVFHG